MSTGKSQVWPDQSLALRTSSTAVTWELIRDTESQVAPRPFESDPAFQQPPQKVPGHMRACATVLSGAGLIPQSCLQEGDCTALSHQGCVLTASAVAPSCPSSASGKRFRVPVGLPGPEQTAVGRAWLIASGSPDVDHATINKGLEISGNHKLALAGWALLPPS